MNLTNIKLSILLVTLAIAGTASAEDAIKQDYKIADNILPGLTCERFILDKTPSDYSTDFYITICKDVKYGCEYFRVYGGGYGNMTQVPFTLREGSCKETSTKEKK